MTNLFKTNGIIIRKFDYSNTSVIFHLLSPENGIVHILAKGAKNKKNSFSGKLELFQEIYCTYFKTGNSDLFILKECGFINDFPIIRKNISIFYISSYMLEIISFFPWEAEDASKIYRLITAIFTYFEKSTTDEHILLLTFFILKILFILGYTPNLTACCRSGKPFSSIISPIVYPAIGFTNSIHANPNNLHVEKEVVKILKEINRITKLRQVENITDYSPYKLQLIESAAFLINNISGKKFKTYKTMLQFI